MTSSTAPDAAQSPPQCGVDGAGELSAVDVSRGLAVLGMIAYSELAAFTRLAADAGMAPTLEQRLELSRLAGVALERLDRVAVRVGELGGDLQPVMAPFAGVLVEFDQRTVPSTWWERLLKSYVGYGVSDDFSRIVARELDPRTAALVLDVLADDGHASLVVGALATAGSTDATLASRLALWGRRLVGEALGVVQRVVAEHPVLADLLEDAMAHHGEDGTGLRGGDAHQRLFSALTADHSRRMERLGLTP